jgi:hypothetical protein
MTSDEHNIGPMLSSPGAEPKQGRANRAWLRRFVAKSGVACTAVRQGRALPRATKMRVSTVGLREKPLRNVGSCAICFAGRGH